MNKDGLFWKTVLGRFYLVGIIDRIYEFASVTVEATPTGDSKTSPMS